MDESYLSPKSDRKIEACPDAPERFNYEPHEPMTPPAFDLDEYFPDAPTAPKKSVSHLKRVQDELEYGAKRELKY